MPTIRNNGLYLNRSGRQVGITHDRGDGQTWRWLTTRGHYVTADGRIGRGFGCRHHAPTAAPRWRRLHVRHRALTAYRVAGALAGGAGCVGAVSKF